MRASPPLVALAVAALLGIGVPLRLAAGATGDGAPDRVAELEAILAPWRDELARPGVRLHLGLEADPKRDAGASARIFVTAYALAPAEVVPVVLAGCGAGRAGDCGLAAASRLLLCGDAVGQAMGLAIRFGLTSVDASGPCVLLRRPAP